ncbi:MAG: LysM peptidoglycan-binding domain-containing protein, partial [Anaerolineae bacterium]|nr:LysM peptidoglycan-binding domain-containing protein [Anaerolineae bacterium]
MRKLLLLSLLALLLIGCGSSAAPEPTPVPRPTLDLATAAVTPGLSGPTQQAAATPLPTASPMPTATETPMATTYTVQAGDTLSAIAERFGVTLAALAAANDIANPNSIRVGQVLIIPGRSEGSAPGAPATDTPEPAASSVSGTPTLTPSTPVPLAEGPRGLPMESPEYGMQAFLWWRPETAHRDLGMIREAGFGWVKQNFAWRDIELAKGVFDWSVTDRIMDQIDEF